MITQYMKNREQRLAYAAAYRAANRDKISAAAAARYAKNRKARLAHAADYRAANKEKVAARNAAYRAGIRIRSKPAT